MYTKKGVVMVHFNSCDNTIAGSGEFTGIISTITNKVNCLPSVLAMAMEEFQANKIYLAQIFLNTLSFVHFI